MTPPAEAAAPAMSEPSTGQTAGLILWVAQVPVYRPSGFLWTMNGLTFITGATIWYIMWLLELSPGAPENIKVCAVMAVFLALGYWFGTKPMLLNVSGWVEKKGVVRMDGSDECKGIRAQIVPRGFVHPNPAYLTIPALMVCVDTVQAGVEPNVRLANLLFHDKDILSGIPNPFFRGRWYLAPSSVSPLGHKESKKIPLGPPAMENGAEWVRSSTTGWKLAVDRSTFRPVEALWFTTFVVAFPCLILVADRFMSEFVFHHLVIWPLMLALLPFQWRPAWHFTRGPSVRVRIGPWHLIHNEVTHRTVAARNINSSDPPSKDEVARGEFWKGKRHKKGWRVQETLYSSHPGDA